MNKRFFLSLLISITTITVSSCGGGDSISDPVPSPQPTQTYQSYLQGKNFNGTALVAARGEILLQQGFGQANRAKQVSNQPHTVFRIASLTKQFTAMAILIMQEQGLVNINDPIANYLPHYPNGEKITLRQLMSHTAGVPDYGEIPSILDQQQKHWVPEDLVSQIEKQPLRFEPGTDFHYSNASYALIGYIIETVYGTSYAQAIKEMVFDPLHMGDSYYGKNNLDEPGLALGYEEDFQLADAIDMSLPYAAGALSSTILDLYKWDQSFYDNTLISEHSEEEIFKPLQKNYALGWVVDSMDGVLRQWHTGGIAGFTSIIVRVPEEELVIILLSNQEDTDVGDMAGDLYKIFQFLQ